MSLLHNDFRIQPLDSTAVRDRRLNSLFPEHLFLTFYRVSRFCQISGKITRQTEKKRPFYQFQQALPLRHSFRRLCVAHISDHSPRHASMPRCINRSKPRTSLICPNTGSTVWPRILYNSRPRSVRSFRSINSVGDRLTGIGLDGLQRRQRQLLTRVDFVLLVFFGFCLLVL